MNLLKPIKAKIKDIKQECEDIKTYTLFVKGLFGAMPGQFNMVGYPGVGEAPISLSSVVYNGCFEHTIKGVGRVTKFLERFRKGDEILIRGPFGKGWPLDKVGGKDILLIAGGVGLAPIRPVLQKILSKRKSFGKISLLYGAKNEKRVLFINEFDKWQKNISLYLTVDEVVQHPPVSPLAERGSNVGLVTDLLDKVKIDSKNTFAFICGPEIMMRFVCLRLLAMRVDKSNIYVSLERRMKCGIGHCGHCQHFGLFVCKDGPVFSYDQVCGLPDGLL
ncbi:MAG: FAD/NAD(P)-binding protein [Nitrospirota bacterium]